MRLSKQVMDYLESYFLPRTKSSTLGGNITPNATDSHNIGSATKRWDNIYAKNIIADTFTGTYGSADTVDGYHAYSTPTPSSLLALDANSQYPSSTYPDALLTNGSRTLTGNLAVTGGVTIDGVDISVHAADGTIHHLSGMSNDDHSIYVHISNDRTITAQHAFAPALVRAPFTLGANAQSQLVTGLRADELNKSVVAGIGMSGGGLLTTNRTLDINFAGGVASTILPDDVAATGQLDYAARADHKHQISTAAPSTNLSVSSTNAEGSGNDFARAAHTHAIDASYQPGVTTQILKTSTSGELFLSGDFGVDTDTFYVDVSDDSVYINPGTVPPAIKPGLYVRSAATTQRTVVFQKIASQNDNAPIWSVVDHVGQNLIVLSNNGDLSSGQPGFVSGLTGWQISADGDAEFNNATIRGSLRTSVFVANEMSASGGTLLIMTASKVTRPVNANDNVMVSINSSFTLNVEANRLDVGASYFGVGDIARVKFIDYDDVMFQMSIFDVYFEVTAVGTLTGRNSDADGDEPGYYPTTMKVRYCGIETNGVQIPTGTGVAKWGVIDGAADTYTGAILLTNDMQYGPYIDIFTINADGNPLPWFSSAIKPRVRLGNLDGVGTLSEQWGIVFGTDLSDNTKPYGVFSDQQAALVGITQTWWDSNQNAVAQVNPTAVGSESLFWLGPSESGKRLEYTASGLLALKTGVFFGNINQNSVLLSSPRVWAPLDGGPWSNSWWIDSRDWGTMANANAISPSVVGFRSRSVTNKGGTFGSTSTNYITNPKFYNNITDGWSSVVGNGTVTRDTGTYFVAPASLKIVAGTNETYVQSDGATCTVTNNTWVYGQVRMYRVGTGASCRVQLWNTTDNSLCSGSTYNVAVSDDWVLAVVKWQNTTGVSKNVQMRIGNACNDSTTTVYFDCAQLELSRPTPYFYGGISSDYAWTGTSHNSTSTRSTDGSLSYACAWSSTAWSVSCWLTPTALPNELEGYARIWQWTYNSSNHCNLYYNPVTDILEMSWVSGGTNAWLYPTSSVPTRGVPNHICATWDGTTLRLYLNGTEIGTKTGLSAMATGPNIIYVGNKETPSWDACINGVIDEFIVLNVTLPPETITKLSESLQPATVITGSEIHMYDPGFGRTRLSANGLFMADDGGGGVFAALNGSTAVSWGNFTMNNGDIVLGHNTLGKSAIFWDESAGTFGFYGDGDTTPEVVINTAGQVVAGDGDVVLDKTGLKFVAGSSYQETSSVIWKNGSGIEIMNINTREGSGSNFAQVAVRNVANSTSTLDMFCMAPANYEAKVTIATQNYLQGIGTQFDLVSDSNATPTDYYQLWGADVYIESGLAVGYNVSMGTYPGVGNLYVYTDGRIGGGLYVGSTGVDPTSGDIVATADGRIGGGLYVGGVSTNPATGVVVATSDIYTVAWTDYSATSTVTGWSSTTTKKIKYKKIGKMMFVQFYITGTSDSTATNFTLPYSSNMEAQAVVRVQDNSGSWVAGLLSVATSGSTASFYTSPNAGGWTASNTKSIVGEFFYETV